MDGVARLQAEERRELFGQVAAQMGVSPTVVEKDFWVCWILQGLFALPGDHPSLLFKGGTSLSKVFALIERFSAGESTSVEEWDPADLPPLKDPDRIDRTSEALGLVFVCLGLLLFNFFPDKMGAWVFIDGQRAFVPLLGPDHRQYLPWWNLYLIGAVLLTLALLARTHWRVWMRWADFALSVLLVGILWWTVGGESILPAQAAAQAVGGGDASAADAFEETALPVLRVVFRAGLWIWLAGAVLSAIGKGYKAVRDALTS